MCVGGRGYGQAGMVVTVVLFGYAVCRSLGVEHCERDRLVGYSGVGVPSEREGCRLLSLPCGQADDN